MESVSWLHLSDYHAGQPDEHDEGLTRQSLVSDIKRTIDAEEIAPPDFLFFTGDAAYGAAQGAAPLDDQFVQAAAFLLDIAKHAGIEESNIFIVPGNHDLDRSKASVIGRMLSEGASNALEPARSLLANPQSIESQALFAPLASYRCFINESFDHLDVDHPIGAYNIKRTAPGGTIVSIAGWNSAWTAYGGGASMSDYGRLYAASAVQHKLTDDTPSPGRGSEDDPAVRILLMHHHPRWLIESEALRTERLIERRFDIFLHGHEHEARDQANSGKVVTFGGVAVYDSSTPLVGYRHMTLDVEAGLLRETTRLYDRENGSFLHRDATAYDLRPSGHRQPSRNVQVPEKSAITRRIPASGGASQTIGREQEVKEGADVLRRRQIFVVVGPPGQGKTHVAKDIAQHVFDAYPDGAWIINAKNESRVDTVRDQLASICGVDPADQRVSSYFEGTQALIILDGFESLHERAEERDIRGFLEDLVEASEHTKSRFIITTQRRLDFEGSERFELEGLSPEPAEKLFRMGFTGPDADPLDVREFTTRRLGGHPLSIKIVSAYGNHLSYTFPELKREYDRAWANLELYKDAIDGDTLQASFSLSYGSLEDDPEQWFLALGLMPDGLPAQFIPEVWGQAEDRRIREALGTLKSRYLADFEHGTDRFERGTYRTLQPLLRFAKAEAYRVLAADGPAADDLRDVLRQLDEHYDEYVEQHAPSPQSNDNTAEKQRIRDHFLNIHASVDRRLAPSASPQALAAAGTVLGLYWAYHNNLQGRNSTIPIDDSVEYLGRAGRVFEQHGERNQSLQCRHYVAKLTWLRGDVAPAKRQFTQLIDEVGLPKDINIDCKRAIAHIEYQVGSIPKSIELYKSAAQEAESIDEPVLVVKSLGGMIDSYRKLEDFSAIRALEERLLPLAQARTPADHGVILRGLAYASLAETSLDIDAAEERELERAENLYNRALELLARPSSFGAAHCHRGLGDVFRLQGRLDEAEAEFDLTEDLYSDAKKEESIGVGLLHIGRALLAMDRGRSDDAIALLERAQEILSVDKRDSPYDLAKTHEALGNIYAASNIGGAAATRYRLARDLYRKAGCDRPTARMDAKLSRL